jgi:hypothetical protein
MAMLAMTILVHFWVLYGAIGTSTRIQGPTCSTTLQPSHLGHARLARLKLRLLYGAFHVP